MRFSFKNKKKSLADKELEVEEIFLDSLLKKKESEDEISERKLEFPIRRRAFFLLFLFGTFLLLLLLGFSFNLQIKEHQKFETLAKKNKFINMKIKAERGVIYDRNMEQLVFNKVRFDVAVKKSELPANQQKQEAILGKIAEILQENLENLKRKISQTSQDLVILSENLSHRDLILIETKIDNLPGIKIKKRTQRFYQGDGTLSHILGYLGKISTEDLKKLDGDYGLGDYVGKEGLERWYEEVLAEKKGVLEIKRDAEGREISRKIVREPQSGQSLVLTLDLPLQKKIASVLQEIFDEVGSQAGAAVALNPQNGEILALVSLPTFDNNLFARGITKEDLKKLNEDKRKPQLNRVIGGNYPVGSTIKPLIAAAALEEGIISEREKLYCPLELCLEHKYTKELKCYPDWKFHGWSDVKKAIAESVNPFFYMVGGGYLRPKGIDERLPKKFDGLGVAKIKEYLQLFGWGEKTGIDLPGEVSGRIPDPEWKESYFADRPRAEQIWYLGDTYNLAIGQGYILVTPLQVATAFSAVVNGGKLLVPKIVKGNLEIKKEIPISQENLEIVKEGMRQAVSSPGGSAVMLNSLPVKAAAKTGTAQTPRKNVYHNWITVFAPYENPEILLTVVIENVKGTRIAAQKAAKEILEWYFQR
ncbi:penicillin-binding protein 2 [bacterium]|nr:penicillin-binding protein 2 [bacterium]